MEMIFKNLFEEFNQNGQFCLPERTISFGDIPWCAHTALIVPFSSSFPIHFTAKPIFNEASTFRLLLAPSDMPDIRPVHMA